MSAPSKWMGTRAISCPQGQVNSRVTWGTQCAGCRALLPPVCGSPWGRGRSAQTLCSPLRVQ